MSKVTKKDRITHLELQVGWLTNVVHELRGTENLEFESQLKQLDQSVFDGLDEKWRFATVDANGLRKSFKEKPYIKNGEWLSTYTLHCNLGLSYDTTDWQNSLIERDTAELLEVDLSGELTGSELCRAMLERGDKYVMCQCWDSSYADIEQVVDVINGFECTAYRKLFAGNRHSWEYAIPINNQGEPLTASEVGL